MLRTNHIIAILFLLSMTLFMSDALQSCSKAAASENDAGYLGDANCATCHQEEYKDWENSHHDLAMQHATPETVLGDFNDVSFSSKGIDSRFFMDGGKFMVNTEGPTGKMEDFEITYTFGVTPLQQYLVRFPGGKLQCLHLAWDSDKGRWFDLQPEERFKPDDWMHWTRQSMNWNSMCADCHSTYLEKNYDPGSESYETDWAIINVSCEACHGPGKEHLEYIRSSAYQRGEKVRGSKMYQVAGQTADEQIHQCARCHAFRAQQTNVFETGDNFFDHYTPEVLQSNLYHPDGQIMSEVYVYGSFLQSKMYKHKVKCNDCHNPHSLELKAVGNALCGQCHEKEVYDTPEHHFHPVMSEGAQCINCHMDGKVYMGNDYRRDHSFRVPRPDLSEKFGMPNACNSCHTDKTAAWAADAVVNWYGPERPKNYADIIAPVLAGQHPAGQDVMALTTDTSQNDFIRATALWLMQGNYSPQSTRKMVLGMKDSNPLVRYNAVRAFTDAPAEERLQYLPALLHDTIRLVRTQTAHALADLEAQLGPKDKEAFQRALKEYKATLDVQADMPGGQMVQGIFHHRRGETEQAQAAYKRALKIDPYLAPAFQNLSTLYYQEGRLQEAADALRKLTEVDSTNAENFYSLGLLLAELNKLEEAAPVLGKAAKLGTNPRYYYNWGVTLQTMQRQKAAENVYLEGMDKYPDNPDIKYALTTLYLQMNQPQKAYPLAQELTRQFPERQEFQELLQAAIQ